jgi:hypothetical protein
MCHCQNSTVRFAGIDTRTRRRRQWKNFSFVDFRRGKLSFTSHRNGFSLAGMSTAVEIEAAIRALSASERKKLMRDSANGGSAIDSPDASTSQFLAAIAVDQTSGNVAVGWYDCRSDSSNQKVQYYAAVSRNGGLSFGQNFALTPGQSNANLLDSHNQEDFLDYTALAYVGGVLYAAWADNANTPVSNFSGDTTQLDIYVGLGTPP